MIERPVSPLLEFDPTPTAFIEPSVVVQSRDVPEACVLTWFRGATDRLVAARGGRVLARNVWADGPHPLYEIDWDGHRLGLVAMSVGGPAAGGMLEELIAYGCRAFVACGGAGSLRPELTLGHLMVVTSALRDEGTSHHYLPPGRTVDANPRAVAAIEATLTDHGVPYLVGRTWTTDALYRETPDRIAARRDEDCIAVEMENASIAAVAQFRGVPLGQILYGGDDLTGEIWDHRNWFTQHDVRDNLLALAADAALRLAGAV